jgi:hypothetical protein
VDLVADDPRIEWTLANAHGIWMGGNHESWSPDHANSPADQWNAGRATDVLIRSDGNLVVASDNGGIWLIFDNGAACVSDRWEDSAFTCLAQGPDDDQHVFAGGQDAALYMTDLSRLAPFLDWIRLDSLRKVQDVGRVRDILILYQSRVIVLACDGGLFWSRIGPPPAKSGPPAADSFHWHQATVEGDLTGGFSSLAEGMRLPGEDPHPSPDGPIFQTLMAGGLGGDTNPKGVFWGRWDKPDKLVMRRSRLFNQSSDVTLIAAAVSSSVVSSYLGDHSIGYAACVAEFNDSLFFMLKTTDGGKSWNVVDTSVFGLDKKKNFADALGSTQGDHNLCVAISNTDPDIVTVGMRDGAISFDGGRHWRKPGFDPSEEKATTDHLHSDLTNYAFSHPTQTEPVARESYYVSSDGGVAQVSWGDGAWFIESDRCNDGEHGNFYAVILDESNLFLFVRHSGAPTTPVWQRESVITSKATGRGCIIQSTFQTGDSSNGNLEVIVPEGDELVHYACPIQNGLYTNWSRRGVITHLATGPGCLIQSDFRTGRYGNLEVVALEGSDLVHYWLDSAHPDSPWNRAQTISSNATGAGCIIQGDLGSGPHGNLEVIVLEGRFLVHYSHNSSVGGAWSAPIIIEEASSAPCFFQSNYAAPHHSGNFELVFRRGNVLMWSFRDNKDSSFPWSRAVPITPAGRKASGPGCIFQGNYGSHQHGNFELLVPEGAAITHYFRDNTKPGDTWVRIGNVTDAAFSFRSDFNSQLATLQFFANFGASMITDLALTGPLQDNGTVAGVAGQNGTPWFQLEGGDGQASFYLSGHAPKIPAKLVAGLTVVNRNNYTEEDGITDIGIKSAHLQPSTRKLVFDNHGNTSVIPLIYPKPGVTPAPDPTKGLRRGRGAGFLYEMVRSPENFSKAMMLAALAAQGPDLYVLLVGQDSGDTRHSKALDMFWEFQHTFDNATQVNAMASADGLTAILELALPRLGRFSGITGPNFSRLDLTTGKVVSMPVVGGGKGSAASIAIVSPDEAYAAVNGLGIDGIGGSPSNQIMCWTGKQWIVRGTPPFGPKDSKLVSVAVDPSQTPATIFVATSNKVYISRDSARSWIRASKGLPETVLAKGDSGRALHWVRDSEGSHVYLASFGRSIWSISTKEMW